MLGGYGSGPEPFLLSLEKELCLRGQKTGPQGEPPSHVNLLHQEAAEDSQS